MTACTAPVHYTSIKELQQAGEEVKNESDHFDKEIHYTGDKSNNGRHRSCSH